MILRVNYFKTLKKCSSFYLPNILYQSTQAKINPQQNYYNILMVQKSSSIPEIKKSFYILSKKYHPDISKENLQKFNQIKQAYQILSNESLRKQYDNLIKNKNQHTQQDRYSSSGPYQTEQQYTQHSKKPYSHHSKAEWNKTRMGFRMQSYTSFESSKMRQIGASGDQNIFHYNRVNESIRQKEKEDQQKINMQLIKKKEVELLKQHEQRIKKLQKQLKREDQQAFRSTFIGKIIENIKNIFKRKQ